MTSTIVDDMPTSNEQHNISQQEKRTHDRDDSADASSHELPTSDSEINFEPKVVESSDDEEKAQSSEQVVDDDETKYPPMRQAIMVALALFAAMFLVSLDRTIIATAIPKMTDEFNSFDDIGWYASAYMLTLCCFQLIYGRIYRYYNPKVVFLTNVFVFEIGSAVCGASPNSTTFIVGRAIAGLGSSGIFSGVIIVIMHIVPLRKRPMFQACMGAVFGVSSIIGPLLGGAFTSDVSWRWCFYINLPIGAAAFVLLVFILKMPEDAMGTPTPLKEQIRNLDPVGTLVFIPAIICILLALQWGGSSYAWSSWRIVLLLVLFAVLGAAFIAIQIWKGDTATVPPRIIKQRSIFAAVCYTICTGASMMLVVYYNPTWQQAIRGESAVNSGIYMIPMLVALVFGAGSAGAGVQKSGYYTPAMIGSSVIAAIGAGLFLLLRTNTSIAKFIGFEIVYGFGLGMGMQQAGLAAQAVLPKRDAPIGISLIFFGQSLGGSIFVSVGQNILNNKLISGVRALNIPHFDANHIVNIGATNLKDAIPHQYLPGVLEAYNSALTDVFLIACVLSATGLLAAVAMEWKSVKGLPRGPPA